MNTAAHKGGGGDVAQHDDGDGGDDDSSWQYTIRLGAGKVGEHESWVFQILDDAGDELFAGVAEDPQDAITKAAQAILNVHDDLDNSKEA